jgi:multicomponent Na+:H+ antiporter subunit F
VIESETIQTILEIVLLVLVFLLIPSAYRVVMGPTQADRLQGIDTITGILIGSIILLSLIQNTPILLDVGIAMAALSFVATLAIARYIAEGRMF